MAPKYKLVYFNSRGLIEPARFMFAHAGVEYEDVRMNFDEKWKEMKKDTPFGQLPYLEFDGKKLSQSTAICRYLAKQFGLTGKDDFESIQCDEIVATVIDMYTEMRKMVNTTPKAVELTNKIINSGDPQVFHDNYKDLVIEEAREKFVKETLPFYYERFEKIVKANGGHIVGNSLTWADFFLVYEIGQFTKFGKTEILNSYPNLKALRDKIMAMPAISEWIKKRPVSTF